MMDFPVLRFVCTDRFWDSIRATPVKEIIVIVMALITAAKI